MEQALQPAAAGCGWCRGASKALAASSCAAVSGWLWETRRQRLKVVLALPLTAALPLRPQTHGARGHDVRVHRQNACLWTQGHCRCGVATIRASQKSSCRPRPRARHAAWVLPSPQPRGRDARRPGGSVSSAAAGAQRRLFAALATATPRLQARVHLRPVLLVGGQLRVLAFFRVRRAWSVAAVHRCCHKSSLERLLPPVATGSACCLGTSEPTAASSWRAVAGRRWEK